MHDWDEPTRLLARALLDHAITRLTERKDTRWGARPATELAAALEGSVSPGGIGGHEALALFRDVLEPACRPMDDPMNLAYVPAAPTPAANVFDLVVSASSIFAGVWESGAGAIAAENTALAWLASLAGYPEGAGGTFVSGGSAANLSALATGRHRAQSLRAVTQPRPRWRFAATSEVHASARAAARIMDADVVLVPADERGRMTGQALRSAIEADLAAPGGDDGGLFAVIASAGTTNAGAVDDLSGVASVCEEHDVWLHVDGAYGAAALCAPSAHAAFAGIERSDSFSVDPHKWLFAPYDCGALVYRDPRAAAACHSQHGEYLDLIDRAEWNPSDYAFQLSRRARGLPLWFSLATNGTDAYRDAVETCLSTARGFAAAIAERDDMELLLEPDLSVVMFRHRSWTSQQMQAWSHDAARSGRALVVPTSWQGQDCLRVCIVNPGTTLGALVGLLDEMALWASKRAG